MTFAATKFGASVLEPNLHSIQIIISVRSAITFSCKVQRSKSNMSSFIPLIEVTKTYYHVIESAVLMITDFMLLRHNIRLSMLVLYLVC